MATILIVDDDPHTRQLYESLLTPFGHQVLEAADGRDGLQLAQDQKPDLIISDILMPTMNGYEFVANLRKQPGLQNTAVVFQSASFLDHESRALGMHCGVREFISKPCDAESILKTVNRVLGLPSSLPAPVPLADGSKDAVPLLIDAFYEKGKQLDALSLRLAALLELGVGLARSSDPRELLKKAANAARKIIGANYAGAGTLENGGPRLRYFVTSGIDEASAAKLDKPGVTGAFREIAVEGKTVGAFSRVGEPSRLALPVDHPPVGGFLGMPIQTSTRSYGLIYVADKLSGAQFTTENQRFLATIAAKLAVAYENTLRYQEIQERTAKLEHQIEQRKRAEDRFRLLIENAPTGIVICNGQGRITETNAQLHRMFGYRQEELVGQPIEILIPEQHRGAHVDHRMGYVNNPQARPMGIGRELYGRRSDGTTFPLEISLGPLTTDEGTLISGTVVDISERKKLEQQLRVAQRLEAVGQLAAGIAHDFNNILTAITGNAKLALAALPPDHAVQQNLGQIEKAGSRATKLVRQILTFSRQQECKREVVKLAPVVDEALKLLRAALPAGIEIRTHFCPDVPAVFVDSTQMHQILMNLATNAADAMRERGGVLEVRLDTITVNADLARTTAELQEGPYIRLSIRDNGCGINPATMEHIFEPFFTTKPPGQGTGLGLSVVHGIVKNHGGAMSVYSEPGKGTIFHLYLPTAEGAEPVQPSSHAEFRGQGERVLYIDDEEPLVLLMTHMLQRLGYDVTGFTDPEKALEIFQSRPDQFDVVVSDLSMPGMSGIDLAHALLKSRPGIPILIVSGYIRTTDNEQVRSLGLRDLILKPDSVEQLGEILHKLFREGQKVNVRI